MHSAPLHSSSCPLYQEEFPRFVASSFKRSEVNGDTRDDSNLDTLFVFHLFMLRVKSTKVSLKETYAHLFQSRWGLGQVEWNGQSHHFRFVTVGVKGDWPFLRSACALSCGYNCTKKCHRCDLDDP